MRASVIFYDLLSVLFELQSRFRAIISAYFMALTVGNTFDSMATGVICTP
jgi:hypothetical protein